jgi:hypothetical protein
MHDHVGHCACGRIEVHLRSALAPEQFQPRTDAPSCAFCRAHDGVWISDPRGTLELRAADLTTIQTFASGQVQFHFCAACDTLVYARFDDADRAVAVVRVALFDAIRNAAPAPVLTNFEDETPSVGRQRRLEKWTPVAVSASCAR